MAGETKERVVPNSKESEMMVLGCMLTMQYSLKYCSENLDEPDFYYDAHKIIFKTLKSAYNNEKHADVHLICEELKRQDKLKTVGGLNYVIALAQYAGTSAYIEEYVEELKNLRKNRYIIQMATKMQNAALDGIDPSKTLLEAQYSIKQIEKHCGAKDKFQIRFLDQFNKKFLFDQPPAKPMILEFIEEGQKIGFLPKGIAAMLVGAGGIGKTHLLAQLAISIATGTPWLDTYMPTDFCGEGKKGNVFFGLGENQYDDIHRLLHKASKKLREYQRDILKEDLLSEASKRIAPFSFCGQQAAFIEDKKPSLYFRQFKMQLEAIAPKDGWSLIILDPVSRLLGADAETDNASATQFIALIEELTIDLPGNPTVLFAHHVNKASLQGGEEKQNQSAARGASALTDGVRWQTNFYKKESLVVLKMEKSNWTKIMDILFLEKEIDGYLKKTNATSQSSESKQLPTGKKNKDSISNLYLANND